MPLLRGAQRSAILQAVEKAGLNPRAFHLTDDGAEFRIEHTLSSSCFTLYRDTTWRYLGTCFVGMGVERSFDLSWLAVVPHVGEWLAELKRDLDQHPLGSG
jgi:hypothetical protein